ncbi:MAG: hypothetical protein ACSHYA_09265 [Opitutaceae bacterium]
MALRKKRSTVSRAWCVIALSLYLVAPTMLHADRNSPPKLDVLMRSWADDTYIRKPDAAGIPAIENYVFMKGQYYPGFHDSPQNEIRFEKVAEILRNQLVEQNYQMTPAKEAELLLVINWGMTEEPEEEDFEFETDEDGNQTFTYNGTDVSGLTRSLNSILIGAGGKDHLSRISLKKQLMEEAIDQERYFINVVAFSMNELSARKKDAPTPKPKWFMILSVPLRNTTTEYAFGTMIETASDHFGKHLEHANFVRQDAKQATVTIGPIEFIGFEENDSEDKSTEQNN